MARREHSTAMTQRYSCPSAPADSSAKGREKARFDQQPVEACATISACLEVIQTHGRTSMAGRSQTGLFDWFLGKNDLRVPLYDPSTGGCRDGLHPDRVNENQGAESTLSFLMALLDMQAANEANAEQLHHEMRASFESDHLTG